jgi:hypothetical protein
MYEDHSPTIQLLLFMYSLPRKRSNRVVTYQREGVKNINTHLWKGFMNMPGFFPQNKGSMQKKTTANNSSPTTWTKQQIKN